MQPYSGTINKQSEQSIGISIYIQIIYTAIFLNLKKN